MPVRVYPRLGITRASSSMNQRSTADAAGQEAVSIKSVAPLSFGGHCGQGARRLIQKKARHEALRLSSALGSIPPSVTGAEAAGKRAGNRHPPKTLTAQAGRARVRLPHLWQFV
jgi:hypothetical protein